MPLVIPALAALACLLAQAQSSTDALKQVRTRKLQSLKPGGTAERNVLYQEVRAAAGNVFQVTALIRDYDPGYPPNRYCGQTCVGQLDNVRFSMAGDESGAWDVRGTMTPPMDTRQCKPNTRAEVPSIPLSSLPGSLASAAHPQSAAPTPRQAVETGAVAIGSYECWTNGEDRMLLNIQIRSASQYVGSDGKLGSFRYRPGSGLISFHGGSLDRVTPVGFQSVYCAPCSVPTVSFRGSGGSEVAFYQKAR